MNNLAEIRKSSELCIVDATGDTKYIWDIDNEDEIEVARNTFNQFKDKNYLAYTVAANGKKGELVNRFDPAMGKIIMVPPVVGG